MELKEDNFGIFPKVLPTTLEKSFFFSYRQVKTFGFHFFREKWHFALPEHEQKRKTCEFLNDFQDYCFWSSFSNNFLGITEFQPKPRLELSFLKKLGPMLRN